MKSVICYLCKSDTERINSLKKSLNLLYTNYKFIKYSDVFIFVENNFPIDQKLILESSFDNLYIKNIELKPSSDLIVPLESISYDDKCNYDVGYRHMCQFFFSELRHHIKEYDWYMRLDDDSFIESEINYNIFEYLEERKKIYGYVAEIPEWPPVVIGVDDFFLKIVDDYKLTPYFLNKLLDNNKFNLRHFYNNIEIVKLSYFNDETVKLLTKCINQSGNIYRLRWGDNLLRTFILSITVDKSKIHKFEDFDYSHVWYKRENGIEKCFYVGHQLELFNKWKSEGWLA